MSSFICEQCGVDIIDTNSGYITGCEHYPKDDIIELSGKKMSDGHTARDADAWAIKILREMRENR